MSVGETVVAVPMDQRRENAVYKDSILVRPRTQWFFRAMLGRDGAQGADEFNGQLRPISSYASLH